MRSEKSSSRAPRSGDGSLLRVGSQRIFTVSDIVQLTGFTRRQVDYLKSEGLIQPFLHSVKASGRKPASYFRKGEVLKALIFSEMKRRGFSMQQIRRVAENLQQLSERLEETPNYLLTDGHSVYLAENDHQVIDILRHEGQMLLIPLVDSLSKLGTLD